jgi:hypothetical protein
MPPDPTPSKNYIYHDDRAWIDAVWLIQSLAVAYLDLSFGKSMAMLSHLIKTTAMLVAGRPNLEDN